MISAPSFSVVATLVDEGGICTVTKVSCEGSPRVHITHVGNMANKGTQALLKSDVSLIREILGDDVVISVSTADVQGVKRLGLQVDSVLPTLVDIPYEVADSYAKRSGYTRSDYRYKVYAMLSFLNMFVQMGLSSFSAVLTRLGVNGFFRKDLFRYVKDCDVVLSCSDENFKESASLLPINIYWLLTWWSMLVSKTWKILVVRSLGKPVVMLPNSFGPFRTTIGRLLSRMALNNCCVVLIRDRRSYQIARDMGIKAPMVVTSDTALLFDGSSSSSNFGAGVVGVCPGLYSHSVSGEKMMNYVVAHAEALDRVIERLGVSVVFLPHYVSGFKYDDLEISQMIRSRMRYSDMVRVLNLASLEEFKSWIGSVDLLVSSKMHPCVLATSSYVPSLCIAYDHKQTGFFSSLGMDEDVISLQQVNSNVLYEKIVDLWGRRDERRRFLESKVPSLQRHVRESVAMALRFALDKS
jgi:polysaccharide pyruvyl transferase WcaK-like protein